MKKLESILIKANKTINDVDQVYYGKNHACRCGCCGNYYDKNELDYPFELLEDYDILENEIEYENGYTNIPFDDNDDECICIYYK